MNHPATPCTLQPDNLSDDVFTLVRERIRSGVLRAGEKLNIDTFAKELGVSKIPVREALMRLVQIGLVKYVSNKGMMVKRIDSFELKELLEVLERLTGTNVPVNTCMDDPAFARRHFIRIAEDCENACMAECITLCADQLLLI